MPRQTPIDSSFEIEHELLERPATAKAVSPDTRTIRDTGLLILLSVTLTAIAFSI